MTVQVLDTAGFVQTIFTVKLSVDQANATNGDFNTWQEIYKYICENDETDDHDAIDGASPGVGALDTAMTNILNDIGNQWSALPAYFSKGKCRDTSIGGNDAVNCHHQFNETDDVASHPFLSNGSNDPTDGMGRVYNETYNDQQQIMYITFGTPQFNNLTEFYGGAVLEDIAKLMNNGSLPTVSDLANLVGDTAITFVVLPTLPLVFLFNALSNIAQAKIPITKYYDFMNAMPLYYRCVNTMIQHLAVNLGLTKDAFMLNPNNSALTQNDKIQNLTQPEQIAEAIKSNGGDNLSGIPDIFKDYFDIQQILNKKYQYMDADFDNSQTSDNALNKNRNDDLGPLTDGPTTYLENFFTSFDRTLYGTSLYVGFRIEKGVDTSESVSNETGESDIARKINQKSQEMREARFTTANGHVDGGAVDHALNLLSGVVSGAADSLGLTSLGNVLSGAGVVDIPEVWKSSTFSKSYHFNVSLRSPYGDPYSILQNLYIPLSLLLAGALPRGIGQSAYTAPFVCRAYCKGMFAVPLGVISNMTIKRGADQFGWTTQRLPTCLDISFEIKDLSPAMYLAITDSGATAALQQMFASNSNFQEYLMTLSGMGLNDRLDWLRNLRRKAQYLVTQVRTRKFSPFYWGAGFGNTLPARFISVFVPSTKVPNN